MKKLKVLSLCDGMSTGQLVLNQLGYEIEEYYASEIEPSSIKVTQKNFPNTKQIGSLYDLWWEDFDDNKELEVKSFLDSIKGEIDIFYCGFSCRDLSRININDDRANQGVYGRTSKMFWTCVKIMEYIQPKYFLYENVESMKDKDKEIITDVIGVDPIMIDAANVSAQERKRYYWTNIKGITQPTNHPNKDKTLKDIVQKAEEIPERLWYKDIPFKWRGDNMRPVATLDLWDYEMLQRVYGLHQKAPTLTACRGGHKQKKVMQNGIPRRLTPLEYERLQCFPDGYTEGVVDGHRYNMLGDGWNVEVIKHILSFAKLH